MRAQTATRPNGHEAHRKAGVAEVRCPYCGQPISRKEFEEIRARIEADERARVAKVEQNLKDRFAREQQQVTAKAAAEIEKARKDAAAQVAAAKRQAAARESAIRQEATKAATAALVPRITAAVNAEKERAFGEKLKLTEQLDLMKHRLEQRRANELGDEAEIDLYEALRREFPGDQIARVQKGRNGDGFPDATEAAQAKIFTSEMAIKVTNDALQMFGAAGYSRNRPLERMVRDARMFTIGGGTAQILRTVVASRLLGRRLPQTCNGYLSSMPQE